MFAGKSITKFLLEKISLYLSLSLFKILHFSSIIQVELSNKSRRSDEKRRNEKIRKPVIKNEITEYAISRAHLAYKLASHTIRAAIFDQE